MCRRVNLKTAARHSEASHRDDAAGWLLLLTGHDGLHRAEDGAPQEDVQHEERPDQEGEQRHPHEVRLPGDLQPDQVAAQDVHRRAEHDGQEQHQHGDDPVGRRVHLDPQNHVHPPVQRADPTVSITYGRTSLLVSLKSVRTAPIRRGKTKHAALQ